MSVGLAWLAGLLASILCPPSDHPTDTAREYFVCVSRNGTVSGHFSLDFPTSRTGQCSLRFVGFSPAVEALGDDQHEGERKDGEATDLERHLDGVRTVRAVVDHRPQLVRDVSRDDLEPDDR
uniref:Putative secreted protein n=1 Tax=Anopheles marajoara TaxID=58244 RepID=A0A2M4C8A5_9DIPT